MDEHLKQRLVGAAVLIALAVIFLPSFFQRDQRVEIDTRSQIPTAPSIEPIVINKPVKPENTIIPKASELFQPATPKPVDKEIAKGSIDSQKAAQAVVNQQKENTASKKATTKTAKVDAKLNAKGVPVGWVLQVASFKSKDSAEKFVKTLNQGNDQAYFRQVKTGQGQFYRVYLGPLIDKNQALVKQKTIDKKHKVKSQLLRFNPISGN